jgi:phosphate/sulfate permease
MNTPEPPPYPVSPPPVQSPQHYNQQPPQNNGLAVASLVTGIVGTTGCCCCPLLASSLAAIICGHLGLGRARQLMGKGKQMAVIGLILGYLSFIGFGAVMVVQFTSPEFQKAVEEMKANFEKAFKEEMEKQKKQEPLPE